MLINPFTRVRNFAGSNPIAARYAMDGLLAALAVNIGVNNNNLFALRLGAGDYQLSLVNFLPQIFTMLILIPGGLFAGSLHNKRRMVIGALITAALGYLLCALSPYFRFANPGSEFISKYSIYFFLAFLSLAAGSTATYNISWQSFFPEVVDRQNRNRVFTMRTHMDVFISIPLPLLVGTILLQASTGRGKILVHQCFYFCAAMFLILAAINYRSIKAVRPAAPKRVSFSELKKGIKSLLHNKPYMLFIGVAIFFYMTWHFDWTLYFIGQVSYLKMNEFQIGLTTLGATVAQFLTMRFWSRRNEKHGVVLPVTFGILGLSLCPVAMIISLSLPISIAPYVFLALHAIVSLPLAAITLNMIQCLLQVADEEYHSFSISVYTCLVCLSNAVMPVAGIALYRALGGDRSGLRYAFAIIFVLRIVAAFLWLLRRKMQHLDVSKR
ncbi:MAG: MFS transporter [Treponema sp.]|jgi:MFS family permease|nr:MFS transporter [Treponema sp.]